jgi:hypothetical protein
MSDKKPGNHPWKARSGVAFLRIKFKEYYMEHEAYLNNLKADMQEEGGPPERPGAKVRAPKHNYRKGYVE